MNPVRKSLVTVGVAVGVFLPATAFAHPQQPGGGTVARPLDWVVLVMFAALGLFVLIVSGATLLRLGLYRRRQLLSARTQALLTSSLAGCALVAFVAFIFTQFTF